MSMRETGRIARVCALLTVLALLAALLPVSMGQIAYADSTVYGKTTSGNIRFRKSASTDSDSWDSLPQGWVAIILDTVTADGIKWIKIKCVIPSDRSKYYTGYVSADYFRDLTESETARYLAEKEPSGKEEPGTLYSDWALSTGDNVRLRADASTNSNILASLSMNTPLQILTAPATRTADDWFYVCCGGTLFGYVNSQYLRVLTQSEAVAMGLMEEPTPAPTQDPYTLKGYIKFTHGNVTFRDAPTIKGNKLGVINTGSVIPYYFRTTTKTDNYYWVCCLYNGKIGYVAESMIVYVQGGETPVPVNTPTPYKPVTPTPTPYKPVTPTPTQSPGDIAGYIKFTHGNVTFRDAPTINGSKLGVIKAGTVIPYYSRTTTKTDNYYWVCCLYNGKIGYVAESMIIYVDDGGKTPTVQPTSTPVVTSIPTKTPAPTEKPIDTDQYVKTTTGGLNIRETPGGKSMGTLNKGVVMPYYGKDTSGDWCLVYNSVYGFGYISSKYASLCDENGKNVTPTPAPTDTPVEAVGYVAITASAVNVRRSSTTDSEIVDTVRKGDVVKLIGSPVQVAGGSSYEWYPIETASGRRGYVRNDNAYRMSDWQIEIWKNSGKLATPSPAPTQTPTGYSNYLKVTSGKINVRTSTSTTSALAGTALKDQVFEYTSGTKVGSYTWYRVLDGSFKNGYGYIRSDLVRRLTWAEYEEWRAKHETPTPGPIVSPTPSKGPAVENLSDLGITLTNNANIRSGASTGTLSLIRIPSKDTLVVYLGEYVRESETKIWYYIQTGNVTGWMRSDVLQVFTERQKAAYQQSGNPDNPPEAEYTTLTLGNVGNPVTELQRELYKQGFLQSENDITGVYNSTTVNAVENFQKDRGLSVDGIAGPMTQHTLFNTVPVGTYSHSTVDPVLQKVEKADWYNVVSNVWEPGDIAIVTTVDFVNGKHLSFRAKRWSGSQHADVEPLTAEDTKVMCLIYGVSDAQEILEKNLYQRIPVWVTLEGRTFAGSMYGVPHNYPEGDTIKDNDFSGQFCIHFVNSKTHGSTASPAHVDSDHQRMIQYAYDNSISGKK